MDQAQPIQPVPPAVPAGRRRRSILGPVVLICVGVFFLLANVLPGFHPWWFFSRYWPVLLIAAGLGKVWDYYSAHRDGGTEDRTRNEMAVGLGLILLVVLLVLGVWRFDRQPQHYDRSETRSVDLQGANSVAAKLEMGAGMLDIRGGSDKLLDADMHYDSADANPEIDYTVTGAQGQLDLSEARHRDVRLGGEDSDWKLRFNRTVPLDLNLEMGAGQSELHLGELNLTHLEINIGAGQLNLDLTGPRKQNLEADVEGGAGQATIHLPKDVGVRVHAEGGLGVIDTHGLTKQGDEYVNAVYGKTPVSIDLTVQGGVGEIDLRQED